MNVLSEEVRKALFCQKNGKYQEMWDIISKMEDTDEAEALMMLAQVFYLGGKSVGLDIEQDMEKGKALMKKAADLGCFEAQFCYADLLVMGSDREEKKLGYDIMEQLALNRYIPAIRKMAYYCRVDARNHIMGEGYFQPDFVGAMYWRKMLLNELKECQDSVFGHAENLIRDAEYRRLLKTEKIEREISEVLGISGELGSRDAMDMLAEYYKRKADTDKKNIIKALYWSCKEEEALNDELEDDFDDEFEADFCDNLMIKSLIRKLVDD